MFSDDDIEAALDAYYAGFAWRTMKPRDCGADVWEPAQIARMRASLEAALASHRDREGSKFALDRTGVEGG